jgi:hypothetical protein
MFKVLKVKEITGWRLFFLYIFLLFLVYMAAFGTFVSVLWFYDKMVEPSRTVSSRLLKYHGVQASWEYKGTWYFTYNWKDHYNKKKWVKL